MTRPAYRARIARLLGTVSPLTGAQIRRALDDRPGRELSINTVMNTVRGMQGDGALRPVRASRRQRLQKDRGVAPPAWELAT